MSQMPPPGYPPGYPPNFPPQGPGGYALPPAMRTSAAAITSLVCGLILCVPVVTGLVALITGFVGISSTGNPAVKGRGMAIAGIILGLINLGIWGSVGYGGFTLYRNSAPDRMFAQSYMADLAAGRIDQCAQNSTSNLTQQTLQNDYAQLKPWGTFQTATIIPNAWNHTNGKTSIGLTGACIFSGGTHRFMMTVINDSGTRKVDSFQWLP